MRMRAGSLLIFEASRLRHGSPRSHKFDLRLMPGDRRQLRIACDKWRCERFGQRQVSRIVCCDVVSQFPDAGQERRMWVARYWKIGEILERLRTSPGVEHA